MNILDDQARAQARSALESAGCDVTGIDSARNGLQVRIKSNSFGRFASTCLRLGAQYKNLHYFPVGSEPVDDEFRHDGNYPGSRGFTCNALVCFPSDVYSRLHLSP